MNFEEAKRLFDAGSSAMAKNAWSEAEAHFRQSLRLLPNRPSTLNNLCVALLNLNRFEEAFKIAEQAIAQQPENPLGYINRGLLNEKLEQFNLAEVDFKKAIELDPSKDAGWNNLGLLLHRLGRYSDALFNFDEAIRANPFSAESWTNRGNVLRSMGFIGEALYSHEKAISINSSFASAWSNKGNALVDEGRLEDGLECLTKAIKIDCRHPNGFLNRGIALARMARHKEALDDFDEALLIKPNLDDAMWNKALSLLTLGNFREGWRLYEVRWTRGEFKALDFPSSELRWDGTLITPGQKILLCAEQGLGDTIQFSRFLNQLTTLGADVIVEVQKPLVSLFKTLEPKISVIRQGDKRPVFDFFCPMLSLPFALKTELDNLPAPTQFNKLPKPEIKKWARVQGVAGLKKIGFANSGNPGHKNDLNRSIPFEVFRRLVSPTHQWVRLQPNAANGGDQSYSAPGMLDVSHLIQDFSDTASIISELDLVISVDTSVAHLSASMGKPTWLLLAFSADFRWLESRSDSPWYPTMRLFRQTRPGDWETVLADVAKNLLETYG
jgi:tetratricopeptide (TPR) repeat protein